MPASPLSKWSKETIGTAGDVDWFRFVTSDARYVQVVLGSLPANYQVELFADCRTRIAGMNRPGMQFEEIIRSLGRGDYFVRVAGVKGASGSTPYALRFRPLARGVSALSYSTWVADGYLYVAGEVFNSTKDPRQFLEVNVTLYDSANRIVGHDFTYAEDAGPRGRSPFKIIASVPNGYHHLKLRVDSGSVTAPLVGKLAHTVGVSRVDYGCRAFPGEVRNDNSFTARFVQVDVLLYDANGGVVNTDFSFTSPDSLRPGQRGGYEIHVCERYDANRVAFFLSAMR